MSDNDDRQGGQQDHAALGPSHSRLMLEKRGVLLRDGCDDPLRWLRGDARNEDASSSGSGDTIERSSRERAGEAFVRVWPREPRLSDLVEMDVSVDAQPGVEIKPPAFGQAVGDFLVRDYSERPAEAGEKNLRRFHYQLEPAHAGKHLIRSVSIEFVDRRPSSERQGEPTLIETDPLELNVTSELGTARRVLRISNRCCRRSRCRRRRRSAG